MKPHILCALIGIAHVAHLQATPVISEFLASGPGHDWIEIQNTGDAQINLAGYHLTDDPDNLSRWTFPSTTVAPGNFVVVYASGQDLTDPAGELHANFKLNAAGGFLALSTSEGSTISAFQDYPPQRSGISYGIAISNTVYFKSPSLGKANPARGLLGFVADTKFSVDRGYYEEAFEVAITTATEDATILYTTDGRAPSKGSVFTGPIGEIYAGPITINTTTTLRAIAMKDNYEPSNIDTQTYLFLNDAIRQDGAHLIEEWGDDWGSGEDADYEMDPRIVDGPQWRDTILEDFKTLPVLSLTVEPEDFFSLNKGIYPGKIGQDGIDIPASAELLHPDGKEGFQIDCAVRIVGQTSPQRWKIKKLSMRLRFDGDFGPGTLKYPLYDDPTAVDEFNTLTVDARHNNTWAYNGGSIPAQQREWTQYLRDQTAADLHREMGGLSPHGRYVFTFVNGMFWGMYNLHERPDDAFNASYQGGKRADWVVSRHGDPGNGGVDVSGDAISLYRAFNNFVRDADDPDVYAQIKDQLDVGDFINYMLVNVGLANGDWGHKNYYVSQSPIDGKWRFHSWDAEKVFQRVNDDLTDRNNNPGPTGMHHSLDANADYRIQFADAIAEHFFNGGVMSTEGLQRVYKRRTDEIERAVILESARWGDAARSNPYTKEDWDAERDRLMNDYFVQRPDIAVDQFKDADLFGDLDFPTFGDHGGHFDNGYAVTIKQSLFANGNLFYTTDGSDPRLPGGKLSTDALPYDNPFVLSESATVKARRYKGSIFGSTEWSPLLEADFVIGAVPATSSNLRISKINYHPSEASDAEKATGFSRKDFEFIGLTNVSNESISLYGTELAEGIRFEFDNVTNSQIPTGGTAFLVKDSAAFTMRYGSNHAVLGEYQGSLSNDGEQLTLHADGTVLADFTYNDVDPWPTDADGNGTYLVLADLNAPAEGYPVGRWRSSTPDDSPSASATPPRSDEDTDGDGYLDHLETLLGSDPNKAASIPYLSAISSDDGTPIFEISIPTDSTSTVTLESSANLDAWTEVSDPALETLTPRPSHLSNAEIQRYRVRQLTRDAAWTERYVRFSIKAP